MTARDDLLVAGWSPVQAEAILRGELPVEFVDLDVEDETLAALVEDDAVRANLQVAIEAGERVDQDPFRMTQVAIMLLGTAGAIARQSGHRAFADALRSIADAVRQLDV